MCAIAGFFSLLAHPEAPARLRAQIEVQSHRGPDGMGAYLTMESHLLPSQGRGDSAFRTGEALFQPCESALEGMTIAVQPPGAPQVGLANRRLAIVDREHGQQPVFNEDHTIVAVMNGELYNHQPLRAGLVARGHRFSAASDTEVLVHLYEEVGIEGLLPRLRGMFALAIWDGRTGTLHLARDPIGEKPLHLLQTTDALYFASEPKGLLVLPEVTRRFHPDALCRYLLHESVPGRQTLFDGIERLEPGWRLSIARTGRELRPWCALDPVQAELETIQAVLAVPWRSNPEAHGCLPRFSGEGQGTPPSTELGWLSLLEQTIQRAVRGQLMGEVPVGVLLSGGLDSSLVAAMAGREQPGISSFSLGFHEEGFDESLHAERVASWLGLKHTRVTLGMDALEGELDRVLERLDEPLADGSLIPTSLLCRAVRAAGVGVALTGDGGDEALGGYPTYLAARAFPLEHPWAEGARGVLSRGARALAEGLPRSFGNLTPDFLARRTLAGLDFTGPRRHALWMSGLEPAALAEVLFPEWQEGLLPERLFASYDALSPLSERLSWPSNVQRLDLARYLPDDLLVKSDRASMAWGLELRAPLLDPGVVALGLSMPANLKLYGLQTKVALRRIGQHWLPRDILTRKKKGFGMPTAWWLQRLPEGLVRAWLTPPPGAVPIFRLEVVMRWLREHRAGIRDHRKRLWPILMLERWRGGRWGIR